MKETGERQGKKEIMLSIIFFKKTIEVFFESSTEGERIPHLIH
jgi:hypothetical protein